MQTARAGILKPIFFAELMAKPNYQYEKRQKDLAKQRKKQEKEQEKALRKASKTADVDNGNPATAETPAEETAQASEQ
jgi:hypothetical protein